MIEIHTYKCEVCGKEFDDEDECLKHELKCKTTVGLEDSVVMMDSGRNILPLDNWKKAIDRVYFVYVANQEAADKLEDLFHEYNYSFPQTTRGRRFFILLCSPIRRMECIGNLCKTLKTNTTNFLRLRMNCGTICSTKMLVNKMWPPLDKTLGGAFSGKTRRVLFYCTGCQKITANFVQIDG